MPSETTYPLIEYTRPANYGLVRAECLGCGKPLGWFIRPQEMYCDTCTGLLKQRGWSTGCEGGVCLVPLAGKELA